MQRKSGFTLIELLVVVAIIAVLAAILFPVFTAAKKRSVMIKCLNNLRQLSEAMMHYATDCDGTMPCVGWGGLPNWCGSVGKKVDSIVDAGGGWVYPERGQIWPYVRNASMYMCSVDRGRESQYITEVPTGFKLKDFPLSYSMNDYLNKAKPDSLPVRTFSKLLLLIHEERTRINDGIFIGTKGYEQDIPDHVHYDGTTIVYADCHARWGSYENLLEEREQGYWNPSSNK